MKILFLLLTQIITGTIAFSQNHNKTEPPSQIMPVSQSVTSGLYPFPGNSSDHIILSGKTTHFSDMILQVESLYKKNGERQLRVSEEQILIMKEGEAIVKWSQETKTIGPGSVFFLLPGEDGTITSQSPSTVYYRMIYKSVDPPIPGLSNQDNRSAIIDYDDLAFNQTSKGGVRKYFNRSTTMCPYYEMHVTTLNPGIQSHLPHTHEAAEIILVIEGETEMEIDDKVFRGQKGDVYFMASNALHGIRNTGDSPCQYFAFQWGNSK